jgi:hypothetical protein
MDETGNIKSRKAGVSEVSVQESKMKQDHDKIANYIAENPNTSIVDASRRTGASWSAYYKYRSDNGLNGKRKKLLHKGKNQKTELHTISVSNKSHGLADDDSTGLVCSIGNLIKVSGSPEKVAAVIRSVLG